MNPIPGANAVVTDVSAPPKSNDPWMKLARDAYERSTTFFDNNIRKKVEDDLRMFNSEHPKDSKYYSDGYKYRSKFFRPKSRSVLRKNEATAALAFFSNPDATSIEPANPNDMAQVISSTFWKEIIQYRLTKSIPWFLTVIGAFQDAMKVGLVCSYQYWMYREKEVEQEGFDPMTGETFRVKVPKVVEDRPCIQLFPLDRVRFDPGAQWYDIAGTSPYLILEWPMYVNDVLGKMEHNGRAEPWKRLSKQQILQARIQDTDTTQSARDKDREPPQNVQGEVNEFDLVMTHLNFIREGDTCYVYWTLKDRELLSTPVPVEDYYLHCKDGRPPVQIGFSVLETHVTAPTSMIGLGSELQREANEIANTRSDNVKLVLNKRWLVRRGSNADVESLLRNVPGGVTMVNDVERDIGRVDWADVTSSSYQEQDRINLDFDELLGNFAQGSVMTNRKLNETVGGMRMMAAGANQITEYSIRTFVETWAEPVLRQLLLMEMAYETDEVIMAMAMDKAQFVQKFGVDPQLDNLLNQELTLNVNVGMGATDPDTRFQRLTQAFGLYAQMVMQGPPDINLPEFRKEIFGLAGFKDAARFFTEIDPRLQQAQQMMQQAQAEAEKVVIAAKDRLLSKERAVDLREIELNQRESELLNNFQLEMEKLQREFVIKERQAQLDMVQQVAQAQMQHGIEKDKAENQIEIDRMKADADARLKEFQANVDAQIQMFLANVKAKALAKSSPKTKVAKKKSDGSWEVTETSSEADED